MLCEKCWDNHKEGPCPSAWEVCAMVMCAECGNSFAMHHDALFGLNGMACKECGVMGSWKTRQWTDEDKLRYSHDYKISADGIPRGYV